MAMAEKGRKCADRLVYHPCAKSRLKAANEPRISGTHLQKIHGNFVLGGQSIENFNYFNLLGPDQLMISYK